MRGRRGVAAVAVLVSACAIAAIVAVSVGGATPAASGVPPEVQRYAAQWPAQNADLANTRVAHSTISSRNVAKLGVAWTLPITAGGAFGGYASTPIIAGGSVYTMDLGSNVQAVDLRTGKVRWTHKIGETDLGPNGLALGYGRVYGATETYVFALDARTGRLVWRSRKLPRNANEGIDMPVSVFDRLVYVSTVPGAFGRFYQGNGVGVVWALDAATGKPVWHYDTVPRTLWSARHRALNSGGGLWYNPGFDATGDMYISIGNPAPFPGTAALPWGASRPGPDPHTDSEVKLDHKTGKQIWARQVLAHDVYDWDLHLPPILTSVGGRSVVVTGGKLGYVAAIDARSGKLLWKTPVGLHNGHDQDGPAVMRGGEPPRLPVRVLPGVLGGVETPMAVADGVVYAPVVDMAATFMSQTKYVPDIQHGRGEVVALSVRTGKILWKRALPTPTYGAATVANDLVFTTTFDGKLLALSRKTGKIVWSQQMTAATNAPLAISGDTVVTAASYAAGPGQKAQIIAFRLGATGKLAPGGPPAGQKPGGGGGPVEGNQLTVGKQVFGANCAACHVLADANAAGTVGPSLDKLHPPAAVVARQVTNGGGAMPAFKGRLSPAQIAAVAAYVAAKANPNAKPPKGGGP